MRGASERCFAGRVDVGLLKKCSRPPDVDAYGAAGLETAANNPGREVAGTITKAQVEEIANTKMPDLNAIDLEGAMLQVEGTARSMGIKVV